MSTRLAASCTTLEDVDVECTHCGLKMSTHMGSGARIRYFHCAGCHRWVSSTYSEVLRGDTKVRSRPKRDDGFLPSFDEVKDRLERWLLALEGKDPYRTLGVTPADSPEHIRERYRELAVANHPDRGGSIERMRAINDAYERISRHREAKKGDRLLFHGSERTT